MRLIQSRRREIAALACAAVLAGIVAQTVADWPMAGANPQRTSWVPQEVRGALKPLWTTTIPHYISQKIQVVASQIAGQIRMSLYLAEGLKPPHRLGSNLQHQADNPPVARPAVGHNVDQVRRPTRPMMDCT